MTSKSSLLMMEAKMPRWPLSAHLHEQDVRVKAVSFSRNFGKEHALTAGLQYASGDAVIPMDADLQDPPELKYLFASLGARDGYGYRHS